MTCRGGAALDPAQPKPTDPCPCGSGEPYGECCGHGK
ncbi:SEC-C metal-binding domain-containing protein [Sulfobacillus thermosulfidooxidans]